jgi:hypothetical protein
VGECHPEAKQFLEEQEHLVTKLSTAIRARAATDGHFLCGSCEVRKPFTEFSEVVVARQAAEVVTSDGPRIRTAGEAVCAHCAASHTEEALTGRVNRNMIARGVFLDPRGGGEGQIVSL